MSREEILRRMGAASRVGIVRTFPSGREYNTETSFDGFLAAFSKDFPNGMFTGKQVEAFKVFIMTWKWKGGPAKKMEIQIGERDDDIQVVDVPEVRDFSYNEGQAASVYDLRMPYGSWLQAVADYKLNLLGPSRGITERQEQMRLGGPVDASRDVTLPATSKRTVLDRLLK